jgi:hypothetical protein
MKFNNQIKNIESEIDLLKQQIDAYVKQQSSLVIGIISCLKNQDKMNSIRETWVKKLKEEKIPYFFVIGDPDLKKAMLKDDILSIPIEDNYESLPKKVALLYEYLFDHTAYDFVYKIDDDCYLNVDALPKTTFWKYDYLGEVIGLDSSGILPDWHYGKCEEPRLNSTPYWGKYEGSWCGGGYGYFLSRKAMGIIKNNKKYLFEELYEDKAVGDVLRKNKILPAGNDHYKPFNPHSFDLNIHDTEQVKLFVNNKIKDRIFDFTLVMEIRKKQVMNYFHQVFLNPQEILGKEHVGDRHRHNQDAMIGNLLAKIDNLQKTLENTEKYSKSLEVEIANYKSSLKWYKETYENKHA